MDGCFNAMIPYTEGPTPGNIRSLELSDREINTSAKLERGTQNKDLFKEFLSRYSSIRV